MRNFVFNVFFQFYKIVPRQRWLIPYPEAKGESKELGGLLSDQGAVDDACAEACKDENPYIKELR